MGTLHEYLRAFMISRSILRIKKCFTQKVIENIKTHFLCSTNFFFRKSYRFWDNVEKNMLQKDRQQMTATGQTTRNSNMGRDISALHRIRTCSEAHSTTLSYPVSDEA